MLEILQVPPFLAAEICELGMVITMLADSFLAQFGLLISGRFHKIMSPRTQTQKEKPMENQPLTSQYR